MNWIRVDYLKKDNKSTEGQWYCRKFQSKAKAEAWIAKQETIIEYCFSETSDSLL